MKNCTLQGMCILDEDCTGETFAGVPYMRSRYFALDLDERLGLMPKLDEELFGNGGIWQA